MKKQFPKCLSFFAFLPLIILISNHYSFAQTVCIDYSSEPMVYLKVESASASSFDDTPDWAPPPNAFASVDGDLLTRWSPKNGLDNQWIYFDFGKTKTISKIIIRLEAAYAIDYQISISNDAKEWKIIADLKNQDGGIDEIKVEPIAARYIKIFCLKRINPEWGFSMWEFEVYGPAKLNPEDKSLEEVFPNRKADVANGEVKLEEAVASIGPITKEEFQKGVNYTSWSTKELGSKASDQTLEYLYQKGVRHLAIMVVWLQDTVVEKKISPSPKDTPTDEALIHAINKAHSLGMKVMLKPHVDIKEGDWRGDIIPSEEWFSSYKEYILTYAKLAQKYNVEIYCIGTELLNTTANDKLLNNWLSIIGEVKKIYTGPLVYAANWNEYQDVKFWGEMDFIGMDAYFPLTNKDNPTKEELIIAWQGYVDKIDSWLKQTKLNKSVIFSEIGYSSADGTNKRPWDLFH
ncbi:MAG: discoidin domain-containing protein, partial [Cyanobacteriota bacterium]